MRKNNSKFDLSKGFKRVYFVLCAFWLFFIINYNIDYVDKCTPYPGWTMPLNCGKSATSLFIEALLGLLIVIPIYYFLKWLVMGFRK